jgi:hypothetical protein
MEIVKSIVKSLQALLVVLGEDVFEAGFNPAFDFGLNLVEHIIAIALGNPI